VTDGDYLIPVYIPALVVLLTHHERKLGRPLTEDEVTSIRDNGVCMMLRASAAVEMAEQRGYPDIDPERAWQEWQVVRLTLPDS
jgi:hypothetical protein